jgi:hypothetical protein
VGNDEFTSHIGFSLFAKRPKKQGFSIGEVQNSGVRKVRPDVPCRPVNVIMPAATGE